MGGQLASAWLSRETGGKMLEARAIFQVISKSIPMEMTTNKVMNDEDGAVAAALIYMHSVFLFVC